MLEFLRLEKIISQIVLVRRDLLKVSGETSVAGENWRWISLILVQCFILN